MRFSFVISLALIGALLLLIWLWPHQEVGTNVRQLSRGFLIALPFAFAAIWLPGLRLAIIAGKPVTAQDGFWANALSVSLYMVLPGRLSEGAKPIILNAEAGLPIVKGVAATALERILDLACVAGLAGLLFLTGTHTKVSALGFDVSGLLFLLFGGLLGIGVLLWIGPRLFVRPESKIARLIRGLLIDSLTVIRELKSPRTLLLLFIVSSGIWLSSYLVAFAVLSLSGSVTLSVWEVLLVFLAGTIGYIVAIAPGGIGTYEAATVLALGSLGYSVPEGIFLSLTMRVVNVAPALISGAIYLRLRSMRIAVLIDKLRSRPSNPTSRTPRQ